MPKEKTDSPVLSRTSVFEVDDQSGSFVVEVELAIVDNSVGCVGASIRSYASGEEGRLTGPVPDLAHTSATVTSGLLRRIKLGEMIAQAAAEFDQEARIALGIADAVPTNFDSWLEHVGAPGKPTESLLREFENDQEFHGEMKRRAEEVLGADVHKGRRRGRPPVSDETLIRVANIYNEAYAKGSRTPVLHVAQVLNIPNKKVKGWVSKARAKGLLPPTQPGIPRGSLKGRKE